MELSQELKQSLSARDLNGIRAALIGYLDFWCDDDVIMVADEVEKQLSSVGIALYDKDDGRDTTGSANSPREALRGIKASLRLNFSREKISRGAELKRQADAASEAENRNMGSPSTTLKAGVYESSVAYGKSPQAIGASVSTSASTRDVIIPTDLEQAVASGESSSVKSMLIGLLDLFDKTEPVPVIQLASYCRDNLDKRGIRLFDEDDKSMDFSVAPLSVETLRTLKAKMRLNFSLEKMIFAEKIFQQELAKKLQKQSTGSIEPKPVVEQRQTAVEPKPVVEQPRPECRPHDATESASSTPGYKIKIEVIYKPGPLEHLFGQVGKFFDCLFNQRGKRIERPYNGRK